MSWSKKPGSQFGMNEIMNAKSVTPTAERVDCPGCGGNGQLPGYYTSCLVCSGSGKVPEADPLCGLMGAKPDNKFIDFSQYAGVPISGEELTPEQARAAVTHGPPPPKRDGAWEHRIRE